MSLQDQRLVYADLVRAARRLDPAGTTSQIRIALLSDAATQQLTPLLRTLLHRQGIHAEIYEGAFDAIQMEALSPASGLYGFAPDVVVVLNAVQSLRAAFAGRSGDAQEFAGAKLQSLVAVWDAIHTHAP